MCTLNKRGKFSSACCDCLKKNIAAVLSGIRCSIGFCRRDVQGSLIQELIVTACQTYEGDCHGGPPVLSVVPTQPVDGTIMSVRSIGGVERLASHLVFSFEGYGEASRF